MKKILIIEDNRDMRNIYKTVLAQTYDLEFAPSLKELELKLQSEAFFDLIVADLQLDDGFFLDYIQENKPEKFHNTPVIIVSCFEDLDELNRSFAWGAVDYLVKPIRQSELMAKIEKAMKFHQMVTNFKKSESLFEILTSMETKIYKELLAYGENFMQRKEIMQRIWPNTRVHPKTLDVHLCNIRKKLTNSEWQIDYEEEKGWKLSKK